MSDAARILPPQLAQEVEFYVNKQITDAERDDNCELLDEGGVFSLHRLAARIYAQGWADGETSQAVRESGQRRREADRLAHAIGLPVARSGDAGGAEQ